MRAGQRQPASQTPGFGVISPLVQALQQYGMGQQQNYLPRPPGTFTDGAFGPGMPVLPMPIDPAEDDGSIDPRRTNYPVSWNLPVGVPGTEGLGKLASFSTLRSMADKFSVARACIDYRINEIVGLEWQIQPTPEAEQAMKGSATARADWEKRRSEVMRFFERPDRSPDSPYDNWSEWFSALLEDQLVTDAVGLYMHQPVGKGKGWLGSDLGSLDLIDGTTLRPMYSMRGGLPGPSAVAYQQYIWGVPRSDYAAIAEGRDEDELPDYVDTFARSEMLYARWTTRSWAPYGMSCIEKVLLPIAIGYARQTGQLEWWTEGSVPYLFVTPGPELIQSPQQVRLLQNALNAIAGDTGWKQKIIVLPPGSRADPVKQPQLADQFDEIIVTLTAMPFGLTAMDLGMMPRVSAVAGGAQSRMMSRNSAENAQARWLEPFTMWLKAKFFDFIIKNVFHQNDMEWQWTGLEQEEAQGDIVQQQIDLVHGSLISIDEGREEMGKEPFGLPETQVPLAFTNMSVLPLTEAIDQARQQGQMAMEQHQSGIQNDETSRMQGLASVEAMSAEQGGDQAAGAPSTPAHEGAAAAAALKPTPPATTKPTTPTVKAVTAELELLERLVKKGRTVESLTSDILPPSIMETIQSEGFDAALEKSLAWMTEARVPSRGKPKPGEWTATPGNVPAGASYVSRSKLKSIQAQAKDKALRAPVPTGGPVGHQEGKGNSYDRARRTWNLLKEFGDGQHAPCVYCGLDLDQSTCTQDRIWPGIMGGKYVLANLLPACLGCNTSRQDRVLDFLAKFIPDRDT